MTTASRPHPAIHDANRLGLDYRAEAAKFAYDGPILDVHTHLNSVASAELYFEAADLFNVRKAWSMSQLEVVDDLTAALGDRIAFIAVPNYLKRQEADTFSTDFMRRIEGFAEKGCRMVKFWAAPRGRDFSNDLRLDAPIRPAMIKLARSLGMIFMTHVADPDTWFATKYADASVYGTKAEQYPPLKKLLDDVAPDPVIAAHMGGSPEDLDFVQTLLDAHPNLYLDTSATKWMVRELSRHPDAFADFVTRNAGRVLFGTDIVTNEENRHRSFQDGSGGFDLYASRFWALRTLIETDYEGPSPIVDPDLHMVDPAMDPKSTATLHGANISGEALAMLYHGAADALLAPLYA